MSSYPDNIEALGAPGPSLSFLRVQYLEQHGVLPGPELDMELLSKHWEANPPSPEGNIYLPTYNTDQAIQSYQDQPYQHTQQQMSGDGHLKLVQRRPDLASFIGSSPTEVYSSPPHMYQPDALAGYVSAAPTLPDTPTPKTAPFFSSATPVLDYGMPFANGAAPVLDSSVLVTKHASPVPNLDDPFVTKPSTDSPKDTTAPTEDDGSPAPQRKATAVVALRGRSHKFKNRWAKQELALVVFLRKTKNMGWSEIHQILGTHTPGSIADKYWKLERLRRGLKK